MNEEIICFYWLTVNRVVNSYMYLNVATGSQKSITSRMYLYSLSDTYTLVTGCI